MNKVQQVFTENEKVLVPYISGGDPNLETTKKIILELDHSGAGIIEIGIPFSDPLADGPVIQKAGQRALKAGSSLKKIISLVAEISPRIETPLVLMGYYNNILKYGREKFIADILNAGISGVIIPDLPYDEDPKFYERLNSLDLAGILLVAPNTPDSRLEYLGNRSSGFLYCVSLLGVTGDQKGPYQKIEQYINRVREKTELPLGLGFGIDGPQKARQVSKYVDGIIIGSAIINLIEEYENRPEEMLAEINSFVNSVVNAI
ncbi:MAG: tryptophan synthase subunit alpha [Halanaerobiaceae bacterium]